MSKGIFNSVLLKFAFVKGLVLLYTFSFSQNIGIGTSAPAEKLEVVGNIKVVDQLFTPTGLTFGGATNTGLKFSHSNGFLSLTPLSSDWLYVNTDRGQYIFNKPIWLDDGSINSYGTTDLILQTNGTNRIAFLNSNGNVGIGTSTPSKILDINGNLRVQGNDIWGSGSLVLNGAGGGYVEMKSNSSTYGLIVREYNSSNWGNVEVDANGLNFGFLNDASHLLIKSDGNVGIGNTTATYKLEVSGDVLLTGDLLFGNSDTRTQTKEDAGAYGGRSGFYETSTATVAENWPFTANTDWWHLLDCRHSNSGNNYSLQLVGSFFDQKLFYRKTNTSSATNATTPWRQVMTTNIPWTYTKNTFAYNTDAVFYEDEYIYLRYNYDCELEIQAKSGAEGTWHWSGLVEESYEGTSASSMTYELSVSVGSWTTISSVWCGSDFGIGIEFILTKKDSDAFPLYIGTFIMHGDYNTAIVERINP
ncbi:MAG: hypothetical protein A2275_06140 [Bacteroidetes bacterium RIFOXYA12_FULL_35_11]|nr:MAG: hypothetical protein A2X01_01705 [Bacteroidetes bacterium GWF2_35_48]OFY74197.1 MAG: hypothetical protein A2275_06140 [Bacteroidetes bacterium RIFOXYA12_FULL_35_11]OFY93789.1 MAG: hypothetical protein A2491_02615 [Bacteroidetes bacterium RIFOXYC12_FULL_35_7]HBX52386.1 hypothetical protein [Bacteroidales bacterium]